MRFIPRKLLIVIYKNNYILTCFKPNGEICDLKNLLSDRCIDLTNATCIEIENDPIKCLSVKNREFVDNRGFELTRLSSGKIIDIVNQYDIINKVIQGEFIYGFNEGYGVDFLDVNDKFTKESIKYSEELYELAEMEKIKNLEMYKVYIDRDKNKFVYLGQRKKHKGSKAYVYLEIDSTRENIKIKKSLPDLVKEVDDYSKYSKLYEDKLKHNLILHKIDHANSVKLFLTKEILHKMFNEHFVDWNTEIENGLIYEDLKNCLIIDKNYLTLIKAENVTIEAFNIFIKEKFNRATVLKTNGSFDCGRLEHTEEEAEAFIKEKRPYIVLAELLTNGAISESKEYYPLTEYKMADEYDYIVIEKKKTNEEW